MNTPDISVLTPNALMQALDRYIIGQQKAKRAVAIAMRNRWRRQMVAEEMREEISPKNIIMVGPTGVGKTEIARRLAKLSGAPFVKVEVSKFTEVGYVGRDVDSIMRDLVDVAVRMVRAEMQLEVQAEAQVRAEERILDLLLPAKGRAKSFVDKPQNPPEKTEEGSSTTREKLRTLLRAGKLDEREVEIEIEEKMSSSIKIIPGMPMDEQVGSQLKDLFSQLGRKKYTRTTKVSEAREILVQDEAHKLIDEELVGREAIRRTEQLGVVFLDEIDKICSRENARGSDISREGVQRDLLPLVEGTTVATKFGPVRSDHILFIAAGAFHFAKVSDLIPELQGRFPIRVELESLTANDFGRILRETDNSLLKQYCALLATEDVELEFSDEAITALADSAWRANTALANIGARRLHTVIEHVLEELSFQASELEDKKVCITAQYVQEKVDPLIKDQDLSRHIL